MYPEKHIEVYMVSEVSMRYVSVHFAAEKLVQSWSAGHYDQQESWLHGQETMGRLVFQQQSGLAL